MSRRVSGLPEAVLTARQLVRDGDRDAPARLLGPHLDDIDLTWAPDDPILIDACLMCAKSADGGRQAGRVQYAYRAARRLYEGNHPRLLAATDAFAALLHQTGQCRKSVRLRCALMTAYGEVGLHSDDLLVRAALAECLFLSGNCDLAADTIGTAWLLWRMKPQDNGGERIGGTVLRSYLRILCGCRRQDDLAALLEEASRTALASTAEQNAAHRRPEDTNHHLVCIHRRRRTGHAETRTPW